jgi:ABC-type uncharacterized transport system ATPase subunit
MSGEDIVRGSKIRKAFGEVTALDDVDFLVRRGEIHGLLGENGAGKSTLMNILYGLYTPDSGSITLHGRDVKIGSPVDSIRLGIGMVHQVSTLVAEFSAVENIMLGTRGDKLRLPVARERKAIERLAAEFGLPFPLDVKAKELPAGIKQKIEIVRALYRGATLLILDEPTTSLVESEFRQLLASLQVFVAKGVTVIFITHKIREVMEACSAVTVMRKGRVQAVVEKELLSKEKLVKLMFMEKDIRVTESALPQVEPPPVRLSPAPVVEVKNVTIRGGETSPGLKDVSFEVFGGEILGVAAVSGNGEKEMARCLVHPWLLSNGDILMNGQSIRGCSTTEVFARGLFYTPEERIKEGILNEGSIKENILLGHHSDKRFLSGAVFIDWKETARAARRTIAEYNIHTPDEELIIRRLSGGNIQKAIMGRAFVNPLRLLVTHNPTSGLDIATVEFIFHKLIEMRGRGGAVLWVNEDLDELMIVSDRIAVLYRGELKKIFSRSEFDKAAIGLMMIGG